MKPSYLALEIRTIIDIGYLCLPFYIKHASPEKKCFYSNVYISLSYHSTPKWSSVAFLFGEEATSVLLWIFQRQHPVNKIHFIYPCILHSLSTNQFKALLSSRDIWPLSKYCDSALFSFSKLCFIIERNPILPSVNTLVQCHMMYD